MTAKYTITADLQANATAFVAGFAAAEAAMDKFQRSVNNSMASVNNATKGMDAAMNGMSNSVNKVNDSADKASTHLHDLGDKADDTGRRVNSTGAALSGAKSGFDSLGYSADGVGTKMHNASDGADKATNSINRTGQSLNNAASNTRAFNGSVEQVVTSANTLSSGMDHVSNASKDSATHLNNASTSARNAGSAMESTASGTNSAATGFTNTSKAASLAARDLDRFNRIGRGVSMTAMGIGAAMAAGIGGSLYVFTQYESALAGVAKTTDASARELRKFDLAFREMSRSMPAGYKEIANVAEAAAQLGVKNQDITKFTDTMIRMGTSTNLASEDAANALARMMNIMGTAGSDVDRFGSTIVKMGNVSAATEQDIVNMGMRIAGMGKALDMSEADVVALATSLSDLGVRAEMGGSAISTIMSKTASAIAEGTDQGQKWAEVMGMSIEKVQKLFKEDAYGGLIKMVEGLEKVKASGGNLDKTLRDLGINEIRQLDVMKRLVGASDELSSAQRTANQEWETNTALLNESSKRYETFGSQVKMVWNGIQNIAANIGGAFAKADGGSMAWIKNIIDDLEKLTNKFFDAEGKITKFGQSFVDAATGIATVTGVLAAAGAAFMMFGAGGAVVVGVAGGLAIIGLAVKKLADDLGIGKSEIDKALSGLDNATEGKAEKFIAMKDKIGNAMTDIRIRSAEEARMTKAEILKEVDALTNEVISAINAKEDQILAINKRLVQSATGAEKEALKASVSEIKAHFEEQRNLAANAQATITKVLSSAYDERRQLSSQEYGTISNMFAGLDKLYSTHVSKNIDEMGRLSDAFKSFDENTSLKTVQSNLTSYAKETAQAMGELTKGFEKQSNIIKASSLNDKEKALHLSSLRREYDQNATALLGNLDIYEQEAQKLQKSASATKDLTDKQKEQLDVLKTSKNEAGAYNATLDKYGAQTEGLMVSQKSLSQAAKDAANAMKDSKNTAEGVSSAYLAAADKVTTLNEAFDIVKTGSKAAAQAMGEGFVSSIENGVKMVDLGSAGKMKVDEFIKGVQSGKISVEQAAIAQVNAMRARLGEGSLSAEGEKQVNSFIQGFRAKGANLTSIAGELGLSLKSGMKVDLGDAGQVTVQSFVSGLKSGQYGAVELMTFFQTQLKSASLTDLTSEGSSTMQTMKAGLESGLLSADQVMAALKTRIKANAQTDLMSEGKVTLDTLVAGLESGKYSVDTFMMGVKQLLKESAKGDLTAEGTSTMQSFGIGLDIGKADPMAKAQQSKAEIEQLLFGTNAMPGGQNAMTSFGSGITALEGVPAGAAVQAKTSVEQALAGTTDGLGGQKAMTDLTTGLATNMMNPLAQAALISNTVETELGNTTDGNGGNKAGNSFLAGLTSFFAPATAHAAEMKAGVENNLGSTTDGGGGAKAGAKMAGDLAAKVPNTNSAANSHKSTTEKTLGSTTDGGGGTKAGVKFSSDLNSKTGASRSAASSNKNAVETTLGSSTDGRGGHKAGSMYVSGVQGQTGNARSAGSSVSSAGRSGLSSNSNTYGLGQDFGSGFVNGIRSFIGAAIEAAASLARAALNAVKSAQRSNSPAKETIALGGDFGDGFALAITDKASDAANAAKTMVNSAISAANRANTGLSPLDLSSDALGGESKRSLATTLSTVNKVEMSSKQPAYINVGIGGQEFRTFSENIHDANTKRLNLRSRFEA
ncbi:phage tail tape measure protein [Macrococcus capreoli]|uniref:phage tail tape measure protein n=1 Tax=Macrococcus capreoli TaxID=2982690 RepID=UPI0021D56EA3|nr:phage tail tape measure protein [Macrococcus sp. TMW 2.2395]MCU7556529.1 phage tail tape measure protein [Macrococcus sp. TMW 2.2395]